VAGRTGEGVDFWCGGLSLGTGVGRVWRESGVGMRCALHAKRPLSLLLNAQAPPAWGPHTLAAWRDARADVPLAPESGAGRTEALDVPARRALDARRGTAAARAAGEAAKQAACGADGSGDGRRDAPGRVEAPAGDEGFGMGERLQVGGRAGNCFQHACFSLARSLHLGARFWARLSVSFTRSMSACLYACQPRQRPRCAQLEAGAPTAQTPIMMGPTPCCYNSLPWMTQRLRSATQQATRRTPRPRRRTPPAHCYQARAAALRARAPGRASRATVAARWRWGRLRTPTRRRFWRSELERLHGSPRRRPRAALRGYEGSGWRARGRAGGRRGRGRRRQADGAADVCLRH
jgi:hypothetical protein